MTRSIVITAVMGGVLGISLILSYGQVVNNQRSVTPVKIDSLELERPSTWKKSSPGTRHEGFRSQEYFVDSSDPDRSMLIASFPTRSVRRPASLLLPVGQILLKGDPSKKEWRLTDPDFRIGQLLAAECVAVTQSATRMDSHTIVTFSDNGRRHWVIHLMHRINDPSQIKQVILEDRRMIREMLASVTRISPA